MIIDYTKVKHIYIVCGKTDMRRGIDGLVGLLQALKNGWCPFGNN